MAVEILEVVGGVTYIHSALTHTVWQSTLTEPKQMVAVAHATHGDAERLRRTLQAEFPDIPFVVTLVGAYPAWEGEVSR